MSSYFLGTFWIVVGNLRTSKVKARFTSSVGKSRKKSGLQPSFPGCPRLAGSSAVVNGNRLALAGDWLLTFLSNQSKLLV